MTGWHVQPQALQSTVESTSTLVGDLAGLFVASDGGLSTALGEDCVDVLAESTGFDGVVMEAVSGLLTDQLTNRVSPAIGAYQTALSSTVQAANLVMAGDEEQAGIIRQAAADSTDVGL
ncbi:DUF6507 family protein [Demequina sp. NBRC 110055]|uniref:DUF6507 family protein n=1 Tax=Demequina sp. NBRC 110055 TaxID=1570344 RepID=UPI000A00911B|nr:DUF6507 family protein [Demequina sp. NBRC 110055]